MKVIVAGSRSITDKELVYQAIEQSGFNITELISGGAKGVDQIGQQWAKENSIPVRVMKPKWTHRGAGLQGNEAMAEQADALIAVYDGQSKGTKHMIDTMRKNGKKIFTKMCKPKSE